MAEAGQRTKWRGVYNDLHRQIERGELSPGDQIPGEFELADTHKVSRSTVRTALIHLQQEGLITSGRGSLGRQVRERRPMWWNLASFENGDRRDDPQTGMDEWAAGVLEQGRVPKQEVAVSIQAAPPEIASRLDIEPEGLAVRRQRVRFVDDVPYQLSTSWFPEHIARGTALMEQRDLAMPGGVLRSIGHPQVRVRDEISVRMPTPAEVDQLDLGMGMPVGQHIRTGYDAKGHALRVMVTVFPGDRQFLVYDLEV
ncbi:GntR family transcriptional regulator [Actinocorallia populi]|uniref:GntR family transcriptional regulator n=1 Tax=Actinocorallia populi TaxID=2079200 RepID=UPI000D0922E4|nr:GntR family transcriptional regulator [Actinocorallia populi]